MNNSHRAPAAVRAAEGLPPEEFTLIQEIAKGPARTQRDLSQSVGLSLGMTNLLIKRLARKGLIKVKQLDWNRTQYLLTIKGAVEKTRKSYDYAHYTLRIFSQIRDNITAVLNREHAQGRRVFHIVAQDELLKLLSDTVAELSLDGASFVFHRTLAEAPASADQVLTATREAPPPGAPASRFVSLVDFDNISFRL